MVITWHGEGALKIALKETTIAINPHDGKKSKMPRFSAHILLLGNDNATAVPIRENPFTITGPGEYEIRGIFINGVSDGGEKGLNTLFNIEAEGVMMGYLGGLPLDELTKEQLEVLEGVDVLFVPVGGMDVLTPKQAVKIVNQIEPRIVIPIEYKSKGSKSTRDGVDSFLKEYGAVSKAERVDKYKLTKKDLPQEDTKVVVINPS